MTLLISIESTDLDAKTSKKNNPYYTQTGYVHTVNRDGSTKRYPEQITLFPPRDSSGNAVPYPKGDYTLDPTSFRVSTEYLEMNSAVLRPVKK